MKPMLARLQPSLSTVAYRVAYVGLTLVVAVCLVLLATGRASAAPVVDGEFALTKNAQRIAPGPDGNMWVTFGGNGLGNEVARIAPDGTVTEFDNDSLAGAVGIVTGPDDKLWVTISTKVVRFDPASPTTPAPPTDVFAADIVQPQTIVNGPDGNLWTASADKVLRITPAGVVTPFTVVSGARGIASAGGLLWIADFGAQEIVSVTTAGVPTHYPIGGGLQEVAAGLDGQIGFTNPSNRVGRLVAGGSPLMTEATPGSDPFGIAFGADQAYWFAQPITNNLGRLTADGQYTQLGGLSAEAGPRYLAPGPGNTLWVALQGLNGNDAKKVARVSGLELPKPAAPISSITPAISKLKMSKKQFRVGDKRTAVVAQKRNRRGGKPVAVGTTIRFTLSAAADVRISFERKAAGRRNGSRCVKPKPRLHSHKRCTRWVKTDKALTRKGLSAGAQKVAFSGRIGRNALKPGTYRLTVVASIADRSSKAVRATFKILPPRR
jgi:virginiamycin B lyase